MATREQLYKWHVANTRSIEIAMKAASISCRRAIAEDNISAVQSFQSLYSLLLGAWAENRLRKLLYEPSGLDDDERRDVVRQRSMRKQWLRVTEIGYRKHYNVQNAELSDQTLPFSAFAQFSILTEMLDSDLRSVIEIRNKLAHGQWVYPLNSRGSEINVSKRKKLKEENLLALQFKRTMIGSLADIVHDLVTSHSTYSRDFDAHYRKIAQARRNLLTRDFDDYARTLVMKRQRGVNLRRRGNQ